jgi:DNA modification methylase
MARRSTSTSAFGVSRRENHDATGFYRRFTPPVVSSESEVAPYRALDKLVVGDARHMDEVPDASVALVVTSPPYFAGKEYEESLGTAGIPATYLEYLDLLRDVFAQCVRKLEPGGRLAVNVANLGRRPYRSLSADVIGILQDDLRLLLRGEIIWLKQRGSSGSCAWGSFQRAGNPVIRDLTERVIVASKGRFDRAITAKGRAKQGLPSGSSMTREDFMENTLDVWEIPAESATRVGHPAPFPVELPARLIDLYTYQDDLVLDPFAGAGTTAVAAVRTGRHFMGYDLDEGYIRLAEGRVEQERRRLGREGQSGPPKMRLPAVQALANAKESLQSRAIREGRAAKEIASSVLENAGFTDIRQDQRQPGGIHVDLTARDSKGRLWFFEVIGSFTTHHSGLARTDGLWKAMGKAAALSEIGKAPLVVLAAEIPDRGSVTYGALKRLTGVKKPVRAVIEILNASGLDDLRHLCRGTSET